MGSRCEDFWCCGPSVSFKVPTSSEASGGECRISLVNAEVKCAGKDDPGLDSGETGSETSRMGSGRGRALARQLDSAGGLLEASVLEMRISGCEWECRLLLDFGELSEADSDVAKDASSAVCSRRP
jgi:hypothetical protein